MISAEPKDFWLSCGHHLLDRGEGGGLVVTGEFLKAYLARPELAPPEDACLVEKTLHAALLNDPFLTIGVDEIAAIADADARENWSVMIGFRDHLLRHSTIEAAYLAFIRERVKGTPPLFINQLVHVILRNILDACDDPWILRAAELFFRPQRMTVHEGSLLAADDETIAGRNATGPVSPLVGMLGLDNPAEIDVLTEGNADSYFQRSDRHDMALDLTAGRRGHRALARVIEHWVRHLLNVHVEVEALVEVQNANLAWYVGLDAEGTKIGDLLWNGESIDEAAGRVAALYRLTFRDRACVTDAVGEEPVFLILAMTPDKVLRMKPQNLVTGLPLKQMEPVS
jgi:hypothetical protein